jgi:hypothetical protein
VNAMNNPGGGLGGGPNRVADSVCHKARKQLNRLGPPVRHVKAANSGELANGSVRRSATTLKGGGLADRRTAGKSPVGVWGCFSPARGRCDLAQAI